MISLHKTFKRPLQAGLVSLALCGALSVTTFNLALAQDDLATLTAKLKTKLPQTRITSIAATPVEGIFEVQMEKNIAYVDKSGEYFLFGHLFEISTSKDITAGKLEDLNRFDVGELPTKDAIKFVRGDGSRVLRIFADPECGYCKQLEQTLAKVTDVTVYVYLLPILGQQSTTQANDIWCAKDRNAAWLNKMVRNQRAPTATACATPIERNLVLSKRLGIQGTPFIIAANGKTVGGALPADKLEDLLDKAQLDVAAQSIKTSKGARP